MGNLYIDEKFIRLISTNLKGFKQKGPRLWTFRCPYCGDSKKHEFKTRGYFYFREDHYLMKCQNCGKSTNLFTFLKDHDTSLYRQYVFETFANKTIIEPKSFDKLYKPKSKSIDIQLDSLLDLAEDHWVINYVKYRKIPEKYWGEIFYTENFFDFVKILIPHEPKQLPEDQRLVFPIYDENLILQGINARALKTNGLRYILRKVHDDAIKLYGLHRINKNETIQVVEGPIDSLFLPNAVATCDSDLIRAAKYIPKENLVLVYDNQYHNLEIKRNIQKAADEGFNICIFPKNLEWKDINEAVMLGYSETQIKQIIDDNTFNGLRIKLELQYR